MQFVATEGATASYNAAASTSSPVALGTQQSNAISTSAAASASVVPALVISLGVAGVVLVAAGAAIAIFLVLRLRCCARGGGGGQRCCAFSPFKVTRFGKLRRDDSGGKGSRGLPGDQDNGSGGGGAQCQQRVPAVASTPVSQLQRNQPGEHCVSLLNEIKAFTQSSV